MTFDRRTIACGAHSCAATTHFKKFTADAPRYYNQTASEAVRDGQGYFTPRKAKATDGPTSAEDGNAAARKIGRHGEVIFRLINYHYIMRQKRRITAANADKNARPASHSRVGGKYAAVAKKRTPFSASGIVSTVSAVHTASVKKL